MGNQTKTVPTTQTTQASVQLPDWFNTAGKSAVGIAQGIADRPYQGYSGSLVADLSPNTQSGIQYAADTAGTGAGAIQNGLNTANQASDLAKSQVGTGALDVNAARNYTGASAGPTTGSDIARYMSPFVEQALDPAATNINRQADKDASQIGGLAAMRGSFGGSRQGVLEGESQRNKYEALGNLYKTGFEDAFNNAQGQANAEKGRYANAAQLAQGTGNLSSGLATADTERMLSTVSPQYAGAAAQIQQTQATLNNLVQTGQIDQAQAQNTLDTQYQQFLNERDWATNQLNALIATLSGVPYSTTSNSTTHGQQVVSSPSALGQVAGAGLSAAALFSSDEAGKEDIRPVDDETVLKKFADVPVSLYKYKALRALEIGDNGEKRIGPMSQDFGAAFNNDPEAKVIPMPQAIGVLFSAVRALEKRTAPYSALRDLKEAA